MKKISIGIFDDHPLVIEAIRSKFSNKDFIIEWEANSKRDLFTKLKSVQPEILILDIVADDVLGLEIFETILKDYPDSKIIAHSSLSSSILVENLLSIGIKGFVNKKQDINDLKEAVLTVANDKTYVSKNYTFLTSEYLINKTAILSEREIEIVNMIGNEFTSQQISEQLFLSVNTIESHRKRIFQKLNVKNVAGMIMEAGKLGYLK
ncbi:response regulator transcription factor [Flavobacterium amnicola]|uniref:Response regulator transcription factor n=1 Tax=Flavobacterium amnicola TaxID=2506422 RepID=A0A4Q1K5F3_9FLAO|nr:response regulator transcription factor [Flavobacterium amnicola]RXR20585.1 response regulator transcription factor [Flavobacterium amnicola]